MLMPVTVRGLGGDGFIVTVLMMCIMRVLVFMRLWLVNVLMHMMLGEMEPYAYRHQCAGDHQGQRDRLAEQ